MSMIPDPIGNPADPSADSGGAVTGPPVGAGDLEADKARSRGDERPAGASTDTDGVPVGSADADADAARSGGERTTP